MHIKSGIELYDYLNSRVVNFTNSLEELCEEYGINLNYEGSIEYIENEDGDRDYFKFGKEGNETWTN